MLVLFILILSTGCKTNDNNLPTIYKSNTPDTLNEPANTVDDRDNDGIDDTIEDQLIKRFAPVVRLNSDEQYLPASINWYLERVRMRFNISYRPDEQILEKGSVSLESLIYQACCDQVSGLSTSPSDFFLEQTDSISGDKLDEYREATRSGTDLDEWVCYAHVRSTPASVQVKMYDIQYIFFYAYNGDMIQGSIEIAHEADFEHITVRVEEDLKTIRKIYYSAHDSEGRWYDRQTLGEQENGYNLNEMGRPIVYSAMNSHASYPWAGKWDRESLPDDITNGEGFEWDCLLNVVNIGEKDYPLEDMQWIQYSGRWGELGETDWTTGPYGPAYQRWWSYELE